MLGRATSPLCTEADRLVKTRGRGREQGPRVQTRSILHNTLNKDPNSQAQVEALVDALLDPVDRKRRQTLLRRLCPRGRAEVEPPGLPISREELPVAILRWRDAGTGAPALGRIPGQLMRRTDVRQR